MIVRCTFATVAFLLAGCGGRVDDSQSGTGPPPTSTVTAEAGPEVTTTTLSGSFKGKSITVHDAVAIVTSNAGETTMVIAYTDGSGL